MVVFSSGVSRIFGYAGFQLQSMGPGWNLWRVILDSNDEFLKKKFCNWSLRKKIFYFFSCPQNFFTFSNIPFFYNLIVIYIEFYLGIFQNLSEKLHTIIVITVGIFTIIFAACRKNSKRCYNDRMQFFR